MRYSLGLLVAVAVIGVISIVYDASGSAPLQTKTIEVKPKVDHEELYCLAKNIYHESRSDNLAGQYAVADVVLNRVHDDRWPNTVCEVIREARLDSKGNPIRHRCQFSWYCDGLSDRANDTDSWQKAQDVAYKILYQNEHRGLTEGATHYHAHYVNPNWRGVDLVGTIGLHKFYRAK